MSDPASQLTRKCIFPAEKPHLSSILQTKYNLVAFFSVWDVLYAYRLQPIRTKKAPGFFGIKRELTEWALSHYSFGIRGEGPFFVSSPPSLHIFPRISFLSLVNVLLIFGGGGGGGGGGRPKKDFALRGFILESYNLRYVYFRI